MILAVLVCSFYWFFIYRPKINQAEASRQKDKHLEQYLQTRIESQQLSLNKNDDVFGDDNLVKILFIGLDSRVGVNNGHCDAIQFMEIDRQKREIKITAVPRGTYAPLPKGAYLPSDYYVSNSCGLVSLEYGVEQIEKILGQKADYLVVVGFSETMGILRELNFPTISTMRWLRNRQSYAIGEPQRARNHSNFIKYVLVNHLEKITSKFSWPWQYLIYKIVQTDLSFGQAQKLLKTVHDFNLKKNPTKVILQMKPAFLVEDIIYDPDNVDSYLQKMIEPIKNKLNKDDYSDLDLRIIQENLLKEIENKKNDQEFLRWSLENNLWLQIENEKKREEIHYEIISRNLNFIEEKEDRKKILADYILEMSNRGLADYETKGKLLLAKEIE